MIKMSKIFKNLQFLQTTRNQKAFVEITKKIYIFFLAYRLGDILKIAVLDFSTICISSINKLSTSSEDNRFIRFSLAC